MAEEWVLGIDSSNYTTSVALVAGPGQLLEEKRILLKVPPGERGLPQSAALFQHIQNLPLLLEDLGRRYDLRLVKAVAASIQPRPVEGSYMPVFTVSAGQGRALAAVLGVPFWPTSHQEGHLMAGLWSAGLNPPGSFLAVHFSGGTSEVLLAEEKAGGCNVAILGASTDLHAGQLVDRIGVALGLPFPAGPALERLAAEGGAEGVPIPSAVRGYSFSFSGPEAGALRYLAQGASPASVARGVERCLAATLEKVLRKAVQETGLQEILLVGGVAANAFLRERLRYRLEHRAVGARLYFAEPRFSGDNAVGVALLGLKAPSAYGIPHHANIPSAPNKSV